MAHVLFIVNDEHAIAGHGVYPSTLSLQNLSLYLPRKLLRSSKATPPEAEKPQNTRLPCEMLCDETEAVPVGGSGFYVKSVHWHSGQVE
jgi:hypothetical protein